MPENHNDQHSPEENITNYYNVVLVFKPFDCVDLFLKYIKEYIMNDTQEDIKEMSNINLKTTVLKRIGSNELIVEFEGFEANLSSIINKDGRWETTIFLNTLEDRNIKGTITLHKVPLWVENTIRDSRVKQKLVDTGLCKTSKESSVLYKKIIDTITTEQRTDLLSATEQDPDVDTWYLKPNGTVSILTVAHFIMDKMEAEGSRYLTMIDEHTEDNKDATMFIYDDGIYKPGGVFKIRKEAQDICGEDYTVTIQKEILNHIINDTAKDRREFDPENTDEINMINGYYNFMTDEFYSKTPDKLFTRRINVKYNPEADAKYFHVFLSEIVEEKDLKLVTEMFAYTLAPHYLIQKYFFLIGMGGQGKGTLVSLMVSFLGSRNVSSSTLQALELNKGYEQAHIFGKLANICGDMPNNIIPSTTFIKQATGGDLIQARTIFGKPFEAHNTCKFIFCINDRPEIIDDSYGNWRRIIPIEFNKEIQSVDINLLEMLTTEEEKSGIFNILVEQLKGLMEKEKFSFDLTPDEVKNQFSVLSNPMQSFLEEHVSDNKNTDISRAVLHKEYDLWCSKNKVNAMTFTKFNEILRKKNGNFRWTEYRPIIDGKQQHAWRGKELINSLTGAVSQDNVTTNPLKGLKF